VNVSGHAPSSCETAVLLAGREKERVAYPSSSSVTVVDETVHSTQEDLIQLDSPVPSPKSIRRVPGPSNESLYTVVDTSAKKKNSPVFDRRSLPTPPQEGQDQMASKVGFVS
jgi:hypothetical protein